MCIKGLPNRVSDVSWLRSLDRLPVREILHRAGASACALCPRNCGREESRGHVFWDCVFARVFWGRANRLLFVPAWGKAVDGDMGLRGTGIEAVAHGERAVYSSFVSWGRYALWGSRNKKVACPSDMMIGVQCCRGWEWRVGEEIKLCTHIEGQEACGRKWGRVIAALGY